MSLVVSSARVVSSLQEQRRLGAGSGAVGLVQAQHFWAQPSPARGPVPGELSQTEARHSLTPSSRQLSTGSFPSYLWSPCPLGPLRVGTVPISPSDSEL